MEVAHLPDPPETCPDRASVPEPLRWDTTHVFPDWEAWEREYAAVAEAVEALPSLRDTLTRSGADLLVGLERLHDVERRVRLLRVYATMRRDEDTRIGEHTERYGRAVTLGVRFGEATSWFEPVMLALDDDALARLREQEPRLAEYDHFLDDLRRQRPHVLSEPEEALLAAAGALAQGAPAVFTALNDADLVFPDVTDESGRPVRLTHGSYQRLLRSPDRRVRRDAYTAYMETYAGVANTMAANLDAEVKAHVFFARARRHPDTLHAALFADNVPVAVYRTLVEAVTEQLATIHRYTGLRKRILGLEPLRDYDLHNPLFPDGEITFSYPEACILLLEALAPLGEEYVTVVERAIRERWIDVCETPGKRSGAYNIGTYGMHPYILLNWSGRLRDTFTLAHEVGHALHSWFTTTGQPYVYGDYPIFTAEVASTFNEQLLMHHLLGKVRDRRRRLFLLETFLDEINATVYRQTMFAEFERHVHELGEQGQTLSADRLCAEYLDLVRRYWGPDAELDDRLAALTWCRIPHFYYNYYVYQYATAFAASTALARAVREGGTDERDRYLAFLRSGSSRYPLETLRRAGVDLAVTEPYIAVGELFAGLLDEIDRLATEEE